MYLLWLSTCAQNYIFLFPYDNFILKTEFLKMLFNYEDIVIPSPAFEILNYTSSSHPKRILKYRK